MSYNSVNTTGARVRRLFGVFALSAMLPIVYGCGSSSNNNPAIVDLSDITFGEENVNHPQYVLAAQNWVLLAVHADDADTSSVSQGSVRATTGSPAATGNRTNDAVYFAAFDTNAPTDNTQLRVDVTNNSTPIASDAGSLSVVGVAGTDLRVTSATNSRLGTMGNTTNDPAWGYTTGTLTGGNSGAAGYITATFVNWANDTDDSTYLAGGVWSRRTGAGATNVEFGAFVDGNNPSSADEALAATGTATYRGHAYGQYSFNNNPQDDEDTPPTDEENPGYFAAKATLNANFGADDAGGTISGTIFSFFSSEDNSFSASTTNADEPPRGLVVTLGAAPISGTANSFEGATSTNTIRLAPDVDINPVGRWGGRFYGEPNAADDGASPEFVGGVFGVAGATEDDSVSFSIIGSFGAKRQ